MPREHPLSWHRLVPVAVVLGLALVALLAVKGPDWYQRLYHPLGYETVIARESHAAGIDPYVIAAVINVESGYRPDVASKAGAVGLMQVKPSTAHAYAAETGLPPVVTADMLRDPETNIMVGTRYLAFLVSHYGGDIDKALAAYNAGMTNVDKWVAAARKAGTPFRDAIGFPATRHYVQEVGTQSRTYRTLYPETFPK
ncbi:MAG: lytic transglycosylase domain-containing protein [Coriobacteriia bacterium]|nr:lytic transglycosylase domain-containing protein [Coriobacteriia bacterium]